MTGGDKIITISSFIDKHVRHYFPEVKNRLCQIDHPNRRFQIDKPK